MSEKQNQDFCTRKLLGFSLFVFHCRPFSSVKGNENEKIGSPNKYNGLYNSSTLKLVKSGIKYLIKGF